MFLQETRDNVRSKGERDTTIVFGPPGDVLVGIRPEQIAQQAAVRDLERACQHETQEGTAGGDTYIGWAHDAADLLHGVEIGAQATVHGEDLLVDDGSNGQAVEAIRKRLPKLDVVPALALVVEAVDAVDRGAFVVTSEDEEVLGVLDLVGQEQADSLEGLLAAVDVVSKEEIVGLWREATIFEEAEEIIVLAVDITANLNSSGYVSIAQKKIPRLAMAMPKPGIALARTLIGASSSSRMGCEMKISRALVQR